MKIKLLQITMTRKIFFLLLIGTSAFAQQKNFTMKEAVLGMSSTFAVQNLKQLQWMGKSDYYAYAFTNEANKCIVRTHAPTGKLDTFITLEQYNSIGSTKLTALPAMEWVDENSFLYQLKSDYNIIKKEGKTFLSTSKIELKSEADEIHYSPYFQSISYLKNHNLCLQTKNSTQDVTNDGSENIVYSKSVHRDEFGISKGTFWSPNSNYIAFYRMDQTMVEDYPIVNWAETPATHKTIKYPFAGRKSHHVTLGVYQNSKNNIVYLETGQPQDQYLTTVTWSPDEKYIYVSLLNRDQNHLKLNKYDVVTGKLIQTLFEEKNDKYVEPQHELYFFNNNPNEFIWWSQRDGFMHLYHYKTDGKLVKQITKGNWLVNEVLGFNTSTNEIIYTSSESSPMQKNVYAVNMKTGKRKLVSNILGTHTAALSHSGKYLLDNCTAKNLPREINLIDLSKGSSKNLLSAKPTLNDYNLASIEDVVLKTDNDIALYGKIMKPHDFDASKKYPVIVYLYNGPHVQLNKDTYPYSNNLWYDYLTQHGYIVFVMDGRGSANRGFDFESAIHRNLGTLEMQDQMKGVEYLKSLSYVDANRMGVHGWSYGGFMTTSFMLRKPDVFRCGVAGGPVLDWSMYEIMYGERYMDTPEQNPTGYAENLLLDKTKNLEGKLFMIHGADDDVVLWQHSMKFVKKCVDEGVQLDYFVYPGHPHNVRGKDRVHLMQNITDYFDLYLK